jgi:Pyrroline-5-carboxylate reductase
VLWAIKGRGGDKVNANKSRMLRIGFVGAGNIAQALAKGFIAAGKPFQENMLCKPAKDINAKQNGRLVSLANDLHCLALLTEGQR